MIGLDFPVKPAWIQDVLRLWQPDQAISALVQAALAQTMAELGGEKTRRNSLTVILRYFVPTVGGGQTRRTTQSNVWAAYAAVDSPEALAPAYLARIIAGNDVARETVRFIIGRRSSSNTFTSSDLRRRMIAHFGQRNVVLNSTSAFLRTLLAFAVLDSGSRLGDYRVASPLPVSEAVFPLLVWAWWELHGGPQIDLDAFAAAPAFSFVETAHFTEWWQAYQGRLWSLEDRLDGRRAALKQVTPQALEKAISAVSARGRDGQKRQGQDYDSGETAREFTPYRFGYGR